MVMEIRMGMGVERSQRLKSKREEQREGSVLIAGSISRRSLLHPRRRWVRQLKRPSACPVIEAIFTMQEVIQRL
jgi:choline dehydrogenase-like flavoprotein